MTKVTYYMYSCDTCCKIREMIEMDGLDCAKCQKSRKWDMMGINRNVNDNKTKDEQCSSSPFETKNGQRYSGCWICESRERKYDFSLDFRPFGSSVLDGVRSKVVLCGEGYAWTPIW